MLDGKRVGEIEKAAQDASLGFNTQDLARRYAKDVRDLLKERDELLMLVNSQSESLQDLQQHADHISDQLRNAKDELAISNAEEEVDG
jgi:hypothetical protein